MTFHRLLSLLTVLLIDAAAVTSLAQTPGRVEGFTEPYREVELAVSESGVLAQIDVQEGSRVRAGQILAKLETEVLERTLEIASQRSEFVGALQGAQAECELSAKYLEQLQQLHSRGHATQRELDRAATDLKVAQARLAMAEEERSLQLLECRRIEAQIEHRLVRSPIDGVVSQVLRDAGESFLATDPRVATVVQLDRLRARFPLDPAAARTLATGQSVQLELADVSTLVTGTVESIAPVMDAESATVQVTVAIDNAEEAIPAGARCWLLLDQPVDRGRSAGSVRSGNYPTRLTADPAH
jgi:RND family efflux transporter MFP subunit